MESRESILALEMGILVIVSALIYLILLYNGFYYIFLNLES